MAIPTDKNFWCNSNSKVGMLRKSAYLRLVRTNDSDSKILRYLRELRWESGIRCSKCDRSDSITLFQEDWRWRCGSCGEFMSLTRNTILHRTQLWYWRLIRIVFLAANTERLTQASIKAIIKHPTPARSLLSKRDKKMVSRATSAKLMKILPLVKEDLNRLRAEEKKLPVEKVSRRNPSHAFDLLMKHIFVVDPKLISDLLSQQGVLIRLPVRPETWHPHFD